MTYDDNERQAWQIFEGFLADNHEYLLHISRIGDGECGAMIEVMKKRLLGSMPKSAPAPRKKRMTNYLRMQVFERDAFRCRHCGDWKSLECDHVFPESKGGLTTLDNLQTLCASCNRSKGARVVGQ